MVFGADLWASDWNPMTPDQQLALVLGRIDANRGGIVLFHDTKAQTAAMLPAFLRELKSRGYRVVHVVPAAHANPALTSEQCPRHRVVAVTGRGLIVPNGRRLRCL